MSFDTFLFIDDAKEVKGESTADGLTPATGAIEVYSFSWGASNPVTIGSGSTGIGAGKVSISSFNIMKKTESSSSYLFNACCSGQHYATAKVQMRKATGTSGKQQVFLEYLFENVMVESVQWSGSSGGDDTPTESVSFAFGKVTVNYKVQAKDGTMKDGGTASWDLTKVSK